MKINKLHLSSPNPQLKHFSTIDSKDHTIEYDEVTGFFLVDKRIGIPSSYVEWFTFEEDDKPNLKFKKLKKTEESTDGN